MTERSVSVRLQMLVADYVSGAQRATAATVRMARESGAALSTLRHEIDTATDARKLDKFAMGAAAAGAGIAVGFGLVVREAANFERAMSEVNAVTDASVRQLADLSAAAITAGKDTQYSATQAAKAEAELARAGLKTSDILGGGLKGALSLAAAGQLDLEEAATVTAKTLNTFGLQGSQATHVADVLAAAANKSATDVHKMQLSLSQSGLAASSLGISLEETTGTLALFAQNGLIGSDAGTSLKVALLQLANPSKKSQALMKDLGIAAFDAQGNFVGLADLADQLKGRLGGLTQAQRAHALAVIFGADAMRVGNVLYKEGGSRVREFTDAVDDQGAAARNAAKLTDNLYGDLERLKGSFETLAIESGGGATQGLRLLAKAAKALLDIVDGLPEGVTSTAVVVAGLTGAGLLLFAAMIKLRGQLALVKLELTTMGPAGAKAAAGLSAVASAGAKLLGAIGLVYTATTLLNSAFAPDFTTNIDSYSSAIRTLGQTGEISGEALRQLGAGFSQFNKDIAKFSPKHAESDPIFASTKKWIESIGGGFTLGKDSNKQIDQRIGNLDDALTQLVQSGHAKEAADAFARISAAAQAQGVSVDVLTAQLPNYTQAQVDAADATKEQAAAGYQAAVGLDKTYGSAELLKGSWQQLVVEGQKLVDIFNTINGVALNDIEATGKLEAAYDAATEALKENGITVDQRTKEGRANVDTLVNIAKATRDAIDARVQDTNSVEEGYKVYQEGRTKLIEFADAMGYSAQGAQELADRILTMPPLELEADTTEARQQVELVEMKLRGLDGKVFTAQVVVTTQEFRDYRSGERGDTGAGGVGRSGERGNRWGGIHVPAQQGIISLRDAQYYRAGASPLYGFAEPATGGEAFIPKNGDRSRGQSLVATAASWYGLNVMPAAVGIVQGGGSGAGGHRDFVSAQISALEATTRLSKALKDNGNAFGISTTKSRENTSATIATATAAENAARAKYEETGSVAAANKVYDQYIATLRRTLTNAQVSKKVIAGLIASFSSRPVFGNAGDASLKAIASTEAQISAQDSLASLKDRLSLNKPVFSLTSEVGRENLTAIISLIKAAQEAASKKFSETGNSKVAKSLYDGYIRQLEMALHDMGTPNSVIAQLVRKYGNVPITRNARGGIYGNITSLREANMYEGGGRGMYGFAEGSTGGEIFLPRLGDQARGREIISIGAGWYGGKFVPGGAGGSTVTTVNNNLTVAPVTANMSISEVEGLMRQMDARARVSRPR